MIVAEADHLGGFSLYVQDGEVKHTYSMMAMFVDRQEAASELPTGPVDVRMEFAADAAAPTTGGEVTFFINGQRAGGGRMEHTVPFRFTGHAGMDVGRDAGLPVARGYADRSPVEFIAKIHKVVFDVNPHLTGEDRQAIHEHEHHAALAHGIGA